MLNFVFSYEGLPADILMANGSIDKTRTYVFESVMKAVGKSNAKGLKAWDVSNGNDTMISLLNLADTDQDLLVTFFFDGGRYKYPVHLQAGGSTTFNVSDIIMKQQPDTDGNTIPPGVAHGSAVLSGPTDFTESINVAASVGVFNVSTATCGTTCPTCFGYSDFQVLPYNSNTSTALVGSSATFVGWAFGQDGLWHNATYLTLWDSDNTKVATSQGSGSYTGVAAGTFNADGNANLIDENADCPEGSGHPCPTSPYFDSAGGFIQAPTSLQFISVSVLPDGTSGAVGCPSSSWSGIRVDIKYQVLDQQSQPIQSSNMTPHEKGTLFSGSAYDNNIGPVSGYPTSGLTTAADGTFHDVPFGACSSGTFSSLTGTQNITMIVGSNSYAVRSQNWTVTGTTPGHGTIQNSITGPGTGSDVSASR